MQIDMAEMINIINIFDIWEEIVSPVEALVIIFFKLSWLKLPGERSGTNCVCYLLEQCTFKVVGVEGGETI